MGDENPIRTLGDYSKPSHEGYMNTICGSRMGNKVGGKLFDPTPSDSLDLDGENRERTRLRLFQFSLRDQASNWLERLPAGSITTWEDLITHLNFYDHVSFHLKCKIDRAAGGKLRNKNAKESWALLEDLALYDNESWNDPRDFAKPVKAIILSQDVPSTSDRRLIKLKNQVQCLMEAHLASTQPTQVNKVTTSCEICSGPYDTHITWKILNKPLSNTHPREAKDKVKEVIDEEESEVETDEEIEEILEKEEQDEDGEYFNSFSTMEELTHHEWLLKNPRPPHFFKRHAYIDLESPITVMSRRQYNRIMTYGLRSRQKPSNPNKISNFVGRVRSLKIFIGSFAYECHFMILEDTTSIIDRHLVEMAFGRPFIDEIGLVYDREE
ncbi:hypothetical protein Tco_0997246 [Tanacetum coccineum]